MCDLSADLWPVLRISKHSFRGSKSIGQLIDNQFHGQLRPVSSLLNEAIKQIKHVELILSVDLVGNCSLELSIQEKPSALLKRMNALASAVTPKRPERRPRKRMMMELFSWLRKTTSQIYPSFKHSWGGGCIIVSIYNQ